MHVKDVMTRNVLLATPEQSIRDAACLMAECDAGALPVQENDQLVGMVTDRDIAIRAVANGLPPTTSVREVMSDQVLYCYEDEDTVDVAKHMGENQVRRLPVMNREERLAGIVSIADLSHDVEPHVTGEVIADISKHGGQHSQTQQ